MLHDKVRENFVAKLTKNLDEENFVYRGGNITVDIAKVKDSVDLFQVFVSNQYLPVTNLKNMIEAELSPIVCIIPTNEKIRADFHTISHELKNGKEIAIQCDNYFSYYM